MNMKVAPADQFFVEIAGELQKLFHEDVGRGVSDTRKILALKKSNN